MPIRPARRDRDEENLGDNILKILIKHEILYKDIKNEYERSTTINTGKSFEDGQTLARQTDQLVSVRASIGTNYGFTSRARPGRQQLYNPVDLVERPRPFKN
jgi:hypothetical protein